MKNKAFTLIELLIVIAIAVIIAGVLVPMFSATKQDAKLARTKEDLEAIRMACHAFYVDTGEYPALPWNCDDGAELMYDAYSRDGWNGPYLTEWPDSDSWGNPYRFYGREVQGDPLILHSKGPDGTYATEDDIELIVKFPIP